jgi:hypothetical protein
MKQQNLLALAVGVGMLMASLPSTAAVEGASFDGTWHVRLVTQSGTCDSSYSQTVAIENGRVRAVASASATAISGGVGSDGRVALTIAQSVATADAEGRLRSKSGSGSWNLPMLGCTGSWTARRA